MWVNWTTGGGIGRSKREKKRGGGEKYLAQDLKEALSSSTVHRSMIRNGYCQDVILKAGDQREKAEVNYTRTGWKISGSRFYRAIDPNVKILIQFIVIVNDSKTLSDFFSQISTMHYNLKSI